jgi:hypothetical protein
MIQFIRKTGPENHTDNAFRLTTQNHESTQTRTRLAKPLPKGERWDTEQLNRFTTEARNSKAQPKLQEGTCQRTTHF